MLSCKEVARLCSEEFERSLGLGEGTALRVHLMMCKGCTNYRIQLGTLRRAMQAYAQGKAGPDDDQAPKSER
ncbi:MAG: hypothetical protein HUU30_06670 [Burkholderiaceae bacterium]|jgi:hypothetical protein|nr:hypothetical protein [Burkholderiaceae bacterium]